MMKHPKKCKVCGAPEEYVKDVEYRHRGQVIKTPTCSICGAYAGPKPPEVWLKPELIPKPEEYVKIKNGQIAAIIRMYGRLE